MHTVPPSLSGGKECIISSAVLGDTDDGGGRTVDAGFPLLSTERETTLAKPLIIMDMILFVSTSYLQDLLSLLVLFTLMQLDLPLV
jgi:hypothetical protein